MSDDYDYVMEIFLDPDAVEKPADAAARRLHNLGYNTGEPLEHQVESFQRDRGLAVTGNIDDVAQELTDCHDQCRPRQGMEDVRS
jgi:hypothetical protein